MLPQTQKSDSGENKNNRFLGDQAFHFFCCIFLCFLDHFSLPVDVFLYVITSQIFAVKPEGHLCIVVLVHESENWQRSHRLQNSRYFCVLKYARAVKQKAWNEAENRAYDSYATLHQFLC